MSDQASVGFQCGLRSFTLSAEAPSSAAYDWPSSDFLCGEAGKFADLKSRLICNFLEKASATELMTPESSGILPAEATLGASVENDTKQARGNWVVGSQHDMGLRWFGNMVMTCHHTHKQQV